MIRAVADAGRDDVALYTGIDDAIPADLIADFPVATGGRAITRYFAGGLLGQWAVWTRRADGVASRHSELAREQRHDAATRMARTRRGADHGKCSRVDAANDYRGRLPGILDTLRRQGLVRGIWTFDLHEQRSPGHADAIARTGAQFPELTDDEFVAEHRDR